MQRGSRKPQANPQICGAFLRPLDAREIDADQVKNRSIQVLSGWEKFCSDCQEKAFSQVFFVSEKTDPSNVTLTPQKKGGESCQP